MSHRYSLIALSRVLAVTAVRKNVRDCCRQVLGVDRVYMAVVKQVLRDFAFSYPLCNCLHKVGRLVCVNDVGIKKGKVFELLERS